ncbi:MAG: hypothetical protein RIC14_07790 [Filomicrobium sp.]
MAKGSAPDYVVSYVKEDRGQKRWIRVGAAWKHQSGDGVSLVIDAVPVNFSGELVLRPPYAEDQQEAA